MEEPGEKLLEEVVGFKGKEKAPEVVV